MHISSELLVPLIAAAIYGFGLGFLAGRLWERRPKGRRRAAPGVPPSPSPNGDVRLLGEFSAALVELYAELAELDHSLLRASRGEISSERRVVRALGEPSGHATDLNEGDLGGVRRPDPARPL
jgi:hypothetical protein